MDVLASPVIVFILNLVATALVAHGVLSVQNVPIFVQTLNNISIELMTLIAGGITIFKAVELAIHTLNLKHGVTSLPSVKKTIPLEPTGQAGAIPTPPQTNA